MFDFDISMFCIFSNEQFHCSSYFNQSSKLIALIYL
ncbi:unnamed protein product [Brugia timori]|uniref:Uncharacterized protein n=1 Tax=Brugia timori TaxID=42155 RepID=A0A0R3QUB1_9BILA|nr:unnamed protein product [Brugia timori]